MRPMEVLKKKILDSVMILQNVQTAARTWPSKSKRTKIVVAAVKTAAIANTITNLLNTWVLKYNSGFASAVVFSALWGMKDSVNNVIKCYASLLINKRAVLKQRRTIWLHKINGGFWRLCLLRRELPADCGWLAATGKQIHPQYPRTLLWTP